jgi:hypothetical protein
MAQSYPASWKNCATCGYYVGPRDTNYFTNTVKIEGECKCMCRNSGYMDRERPPSSSCSHYVKWIVLQQ